MNSPSSERREIVAAASAWFAEFRGDEPDLQTRTAFYEWLRRSPEHIRVYLEMAAAWAELPTEDPEHRIDVAALVRRAREESAGATLVPLSAGAPSHRITPARNERAVGAWRFIAGALAASILLVAVGGIAAFLLMNRGTYATGIGEQRRIRLADNSVVELSARSAVTVRFSKAERTVMLTEGQALFDVAKDPARPFVVRSDVVSVRAVGTQFDVDRKSSGTTVTVVHGRVAVTAAVQRMRAAVLGDEPVFLDASEQVTVTSARISPPRRTDVDVATAWRHDQMSFSDTPLADVAEVFNRYSPQQLVIADPELRRLGISGTYSSGDPQALLDFLRAQPSLEVRERDRRVLVTRRGSLHSIPDSR